MLTKTLPLATVFLLFILSHTAGQNATNYTNLRTTNASLATDKNGNSISFPSSIIILSNLANANSTVLPIGFDFYFMGKRYTHFVANSGGAMALGLENSTTSILTQTLPNDLTKVTNYPPVTNDAPVLAPFWDNLRTAGGGHPTVRVKVSGTSPNRSFTIEWRCKINASSTTSSFDGLFQVRLYETTGEIEYVYGQMAIGSSSGTVTASIGFTAGTTDNSFKALKNLATYEFTSIASEETATQSLVNSSVAQTIFPLSSTTDGSRTRFTFSPNVSSGNFSQLSFSNTGFNNCTLNWIDNIANESQFAIYRSTDSITFQYVATVPANTTSYTAGDLSPNTTYYWRVVSIAEGNAATFVTASQTTRSCTMQGSFKIGPGGNFSTIKAALDTLAEHGAAGPIVLELNQVYNPATEPIPVVFRRINCAAPNATITLRPEAGANAIKITTDLNLATFYFDNARHYIIDGRPGGTDTTTSNLLTIESRNTNNSAVVIENQSRHNTFSHLKILGLNTQDTSGVFNIRASSLSMGIDSIKINNCSFGNADGSLPKNLFYASGKTDGINDYIQLIDNNFFNHLIAYQESFKSSSAIKVMDNNNRYVIKGNSFYQTQSRTVYADNCHYFEINVTTSTNGGGHLIDSNYFGGSGPKLTGPKLLMYSQMNYTAINAVCKQASPSVISNNTISHIRYNFYVLQRKFEGIAVSHPFSGRIVNNVIGSKTADTSIVLTVPYDQTGDFFGIHAFGNVSVTTNDSTIIQNNTIGSIQTGFSTPGQMRLYGIRAGHFKKLSIRNNLIGSVTNKSSVVNTTDASTIGIEHYDNQYNAAQPISSTISNNTISGLRALSTGVWNYLSGIRLTEGASQTGSINVLINTIENLFTATTRDGTNHIFSGMAGISSESPVAVIQKNTIRSLQSLPGAASTATISGIDLSQFNLTSSTRKMTVHANLIHSLGGSNTNGVIINGILVGSANATVSANMIRLGTDASGNNINTPHQFNGITLTYGLAFDVYHNSVAINGTAVPNSSLSRNSHAFLSRHRSTSTLNVLNNIFGNYRSHSTVATAYKNYAVAFDSTINKTTHQVDNNVYFATGTNTKLTRYRTTAYDTLQGWQNATLVDGSSVAWDPNFAGVQGDEATFNLHLSSPTPAEGIGKPGLIASDYDGDPYWNLTPTDIGADAGDFTWVDRSAPVITVNASLDSTGSLDDRILTNVTITDSQSGVDNFVADKRPAVWFRKKNGNTVSAWAHNFGTIVSGDLHYGTWEFAITYGSLNLAPQSGDTIEYYIVAQDTSSPANIGYSPSAGAYHTATGTQVSAPLQPYRYKLRNRLPAAIAVGIGQSYTSLTGNTGLFNAINTTGGLSANSVVTVTSNLTETGSVTLNGIKLNGFSLEVKPAAATVYDIRNTSSTGSQTFGLSGVRKLRVDGSFNGSGRYLQFVNASETSNATVFNITGNCDSVFISNCVIAANTTDTLSAANIVIGDGNNTNIRLHNNVISNSAAYVAYKKFTAAGLLSLSSGNQVSVVNNEFFNFSFFGINLRKIGNACVIDSNHFYIKDTVTAFENQTRIISVGEGGSHLIRNNFIGGTEKYCGGKAFKFAAVWGDWFTDGIKAITVNTTGTGRTEIKNNLVSRFSIPRIMYKASFIGIEANGTAPFDIMKNTVGSETEFNNIYSEAGNAAHTNYIGIVVNTAGQTTVSENIIANIHNSYYSDQMTVTGIRNSQYTNRGNIISNNKVHHLYSASNGSGIYLHSGTMSVCGIDTRNLATITRNHIYHLYSTDSTGNEIEATGMYVSDPSTTDTSAFGLIEKNRIYDIRNAGFSQGNSDVHGLIVHDGKWNIINNQVSITNAPYVTAIRLSAFDVYEFVRGEKNILYNTFVVGGNNGTAFEFSQAAGVYTHKGVFMNNIIYNDRKGTGKHSAFANSSVGNSTFKFDSTNCNYNLFSAGDSASAVMFENATPTTLAAWRAASGADRNSYFLPRDTIPVSNYFANFSTGNLNINNQNPYCWSVNGKGKPISWIAGDFDSSGVRSTNVSTGSSDIGSDEFHTTTTPPALRIKGNHVPGGTDTLLWASKVVAYINWGNSGTLPQLGSPRYYSGAWPNDTTNANSISNARLLNAWWDIPATGGNGYRYSITFFVDSSMLGSIPEATNIALHKRESNVNGSWQALLPTIINTARGTITATGLTSFSEFTATSTSAPLALLGNPICKGSSTSFTAQDVSSGFTYQWQVNSGAGFVNLVNDSIYSGVTTSTLNVNTPPSEHNGYKYRCITNTGSTSKIGLEYSLKMNNTWTGAVSADWNNAMNWSCGQVPDANTDVFINQNALLYPVLSSTITCKRLIINGAHVRLSAGATLQITGK